MLPYNPNNKDSIIEFAKVLKGKSLRESCDDIIKNHTYQGKGNFGQLLEKYYFQYEPNSDSEPDFPIAGIELKSTPLKLLKNKEYRSKERLVLNIINYFEVVNQDFETSSFWKKNNEILLICYLHNSNTDILDYKIKLVDNWDFSITDIEIIKRDWRIITDKIIAGKAHELSEGDTLYLGACTKGGKGGNPRKQPYNTIPAKQRAYSLKQGYVNHMIATIAYEPNETYGKLIQNVEIIKEKSLEEIVVSKFEGFYGLTDKGIISKLNLNINRFTKNYFAVISKSILGIQIDQEIEEFEKADIEVKTIRIEIDNSIEQSVSFPAFKFEEIYRESWLTSEFKELIEKKFLFIFFVNTGTEYILEKVKFWNMPFEDRNECRRVWLNTKKVIQTGSIFKDYQRDANGEILKSKKGNLIKLNYFPKTKDSYLTHVRPHGSDSLETYPLPVIEKTLKIKDYSKQCFWLKKSYVKEKIYLQ